MAEAGVRVAEIDHAVLDDLLLQAVALAGKNLQTQLIEDESGRRGTYTACTECLRGSLHGRIRHTDACLTGGVIAAVEALQDVIRRKPGSKADPILRESPDTFCNKLIERTDQFVAPERRVVCGDVVCPNDGTDATYICDEQPGHGGWHIDRASGKAWPSLAAWPVEMPVCDAREIGVLG